MADVTSKECLGHDKHLCELSKAGDFDLIKELARGAQFVCTKCGRAAREERNLCAPSRC
jgi:hypothetical protein